MSTWNKKKKTAATYLFSLLFIAVWWSLAFSKESGPHFKEESAENKSPSQKANNLFLSPTSKEEFANALFGDLSSIKKLLIEWDLEGEILKSEGFHEIKRLKRDDFLKAQRLLLLLSTREKEGIIQTNQKKAVAQTYLATAFLLSLIPPERICAIPAGIRRLSLFPQEILKKIPLDCNRMNGEKISLTDPYIAFVSNFSSPRAIEALKNQGLSLCMIDCPDRVEEIEGIIETVGKRVGAEEKAELLALFYRAALMHLDNRVALLKKRSLAVRELPFLFASYTKTFSIPTSKTLLGQILHRLDLNTLGKDEGHTFSYPIDVETIHNMNPQVFIVFSEADICKEQLIENYRALLDIDAVKKERLFIVKPTYLHFPAHLILLGYSELLETLEHNL